MEIYHDRVRDSRSNFPDNVSAWITAIGDNHDLHRTPDISEVKDGLHHVHFFPGGNEHGRVKDFSTAPMNSPIPITDFCNDTTGTGEILFHLLTPS